MKAIFFNKSFGLNSIPAYAKFGRGIIAIKSSKTKTGAAVSLKAFAPEEPTDFPDTATPDIELHFINKTDINTLIAQLEAAKKLIP